jgi:hypothetical protein
VKVVKHGYLSKKKGFLIKSFKSFEVYMLENGVILFYTRTVSSTKFGKESSSHRIYLDETIRIEDIDKNKIKVKDSNGQDLKIECTRFTVVIGNKKTRLESLSSEDWVNFISTFKFKSA